ncbi:MAG: toll/interleukin-1 receptor domain-containing protein [Pyrinomonadaceae bacterium]
MVTKNIFICYRRDDAEGYAGRLYDRLHMRFPNRIFMDVTGISPGADFTRVIQERVGACHALIAIIGKGWLMMADEGSRRRLFREDDYVRHEIATALSRNITVIPVLVRDAKMPPPESLPADLAALSFRNAIEITDQDFDHDVGRLIEGLEFAFGEQRPIPQPPVRAAKSNCLLWSVIGLVVGGIGVFFLLVMLGLLFSSQSGVSNDGSNPAPVYSNAPSGEPSLAPVASDFQPVGSWFYQIENMGQVTIDLHEDYTYQSGNEQGTWQYSPSDRTLTLDGLLYDQNSGTTQQFNAQITIEGKSGNQFVGHVYVGGVVHRVGLTRQ